MSVNSKRVFYVKYLAHPIYEAILKSRADVRLDRLENESPDAVSAPILTAAHAYQIGAARDELARHFHVDADLLRRAPNLLIVSSNGAGFDPVDVEACTAAGVLVVNQSGGNANSVAEHALFLMLTLAKRGAELDTLVRAGRWAERVTAMPVDLFGKTVLVVGFGRTGTRVAKRCLAMEMTVLVHDPYLPAEAMRAAGCEPVADLDAALPRADFVTIHCPRNAETIGMFGAARLGRMKKTAYLVNTARGGIVDEGALHAALTAGTIAAAGIDVFDPEPPPPDHPLLRLANLVTSPHMAGVTRESLERMAVQAANNVLSVFDGKPIRENAVNPEVFD